MGVNRQGDNHISILNRSQQPKDSIQLWTILLYHFTYWLKIFETTSPRGSHELHIHRPILWFILTSEQCALSQQGGTQS